MRAKKELVCYWDGSVALTDEAGELLWSSDDDDDFLEEFDASVETDDIEDVLEYLEDEGYLDHGEPVDVVAANEDGEEPGEGESLH
jgi:hypothetical protein